MDLKCEQCEIEIPPSDPKISFHTHDFCESKCCIDWAYRRIENLSANALDDFVKIETLEESVKSARVEALGWAYADACVHLDKGEDYRKIEVPTILERALVDLG